MADVSTHFNIERGDVPRVVDLPKFSFVMVYPDRAATSALVVHDDVLQEAEAFARAILEAVAARRARKAESENQQATALVGAD